MAYDHPKVIVVGEQGGGKSTFVAAITGLYIATPTKCAIEWHLVPSESASWSATVAIAHHSPNKTASASSMQYTAPQQVGSTCSSPSQLARLLRRAEILMFYPGIDKAHIFTLSESAVAGVLSCVPRALSAGVIYVTLQHPDTSSREITIVDMPGMVSGAGGLKGLENVYVQQLIASHYNRTNGARIAIMLPINVDSKRGDQALSFAKLIDGGLRKPAVIFNHLECQEISPWSVQASQQQHCFYIQKPDRLPGPFALSTEEIRNLRQQEAALFQFCEPWASRTERSNLGIGNILKAAWALPPVSNTPPPDWRVMITKIILEGLRDLLRQMFHILLVALAISSLMIIGLLYAETRQGLTP